MRSLVVRAAIVSGAAAATFAAAAPAEAQRWHRHRDRGGDVAAGAIIGGVVGLGLGAAIASSNRDRYYGGGYYGYDRYYGPPPRRWRGGYYDRGYYGPPPRYRGGWRGARCYTQRVYDPYLGRRVRVRYC